MSRSTSLKKKKLKPKFKQRDGFNLIFKFFKQSHTEYKQGYTENKQCCTEESQVWKKHIVASRKKEKRKKKKKK